MEAFGKLEKQYWLALFLMGTLAYVIRAFQQSKCGKLTANPLPPGPWGLPLIGHLHLLGDHPHRSLHKLSQKYGPIMQLRLGMVPTVVVSSPEMIELFLKTHDLNFVTRPKIQASEYLSYGTRGVIFTEYGSYWRSVRKLCTIHLLNLSKIESFKHLRMLKVNNLIRNFKTAAERGEIVNFSAGVGSAIESISYKMIFGSQYIEKPSFKHCVEEALSLIAASNIADFIPFLEPFDLQGLKRRMKKVSRALDHYLEEIIDEHKQKGKCKQEDERDFIDAMLTVMESDILHEEKLTRNDIKAITMDMVEGTSDTSTATIDWALTELLRHPQVMQRVQDELMSAIGMDRMVEEDDLKKLTYLDMVIKEVLRLHTVAPISPRKSIDHISIKGYHIPKNTLIVINGFAVSHDPNVWSDNVEDFYPERFANGDIDVRGLNFKLIPFGAGRRKCAGTELGLRTVKFILAQLLHCFSFELPNGMSSKDLDMKEKFGTAIRRVSPLHVLPTYRLHINDERE